MPQAFGLGGVTGATAELAVLSAWGHTPARWTDDEAAGAGLAERLSTLATDGVDLVPDCAASGSLPDLVAIVGDPARVATIADYTNAQRLGVHLANATNDSTLLARAAEQGRYTPRIEQTYSVEQIAAAHTSSERGRTRGKIVVRL